MLTKEADSVKWFTDAGVEASHTMAKTDLQRMERYKAIIKEVGRKYGVEPALIAAIISRESRAGNCLSGGYGDGGNAFGLMQVVTQSFFQIQLS